MGTDRQPSRWSRGRLVAAALIGLVGSSTLILTSVDHQWFEASVSLVITVHLLVGLRSQPLQLAFTVGQDEQHEVVFRFDKFWGNLSITVDGKQAARNFRMFSVELTKSYQVTVGELERHDVRIEKDRALVLAGGRPQPVRAYVDDVLVARGVS